MSRANLFSSLFKIKKTIAFVLIFSIFAGLIIPQITNASVSGTVGGIAGCAAGAKAGAAAGAGLGTFAGPGPGTLIGGVIGTIVGCVGLGLAGSWATSSIVSTGGGDFGKMIVYGLSYVLIHISTAIAKLSANLLSAVQSTELWTRSVTQNNIGWPFVRDVANMFIVLGFVIIGIATTLRLNEYGAKKLLPKLIIVALLINFSLVICGIFIDGSNIVMRNFLEKSGYMTKIFGQEQGVADAQLAQIEEIYNSKETTMATIAGAGGTLTFYNLILAITFLMMFTLLIARYYLLYVFVVFSPLAFIFSVFSFTQKYSKMWWEQFINWCLIGIEAAFFIFIADNMMSNLVGDKEISKVSLDVFIFPAVFLLIGFFFIKKTSAMGAGAVMGFASATAGVAWGSVGKGVLNKTGLSKLGNTVKTGATKIGENFGLVAPGTAAGMEAKRLDEPKKRLANLDSKSLAEIAQQSAWGKKRSEDKAAATQLLADRNDLNDIKDENTRASAVAHASSFPGIKRTDFEKSDYKMAAYNDKKVQTYRTNHPTASKADAIEAVKIEQLKTNLPQMSGGQLRDISHNDLFYNSDIIRENLTPHMIAQFKTATPDKIKALKDTIGLPTTPGYIAHDHDQAVKSGNKAEATRLQKVMDSINKL